MIPPWMLNRIKRSNNLSLQLTESKLKNLFAIVQGILFTGLIETIKFYGK